MTGRLQYANSSGMFDQTHLHLITIEYIKQCTENGRKVVKWLWEWFQKQTSRCQLQLSPLVWEKKKKLFGRRKKTSSPSSVTVAQAKPFNYKSS